jgi:DNA-binding GntR family transcriptional regulator
MPKKYGVKEKDLVVSHVVNLVLTGKLRSGDRVDRNEIARTLGLSRVPIQEAVVQLEHDGILSTRYHRGAYVERFDEAVVIEHHEMYGLLNGVAAARAAQAATDDLIERLTGLLAAMRAAREVRGFQENGFLFRAAIVDGYAGPRLRAMIQASQAFVPRAFWVAYADSRDELLPFYEQETAAIIGGDADAARDACIGRATAMGRIMLSELIRRGVLLPAGAPQDVAIY